jgi:putative FmdB family regulatory protein
VPLYEYSCRSCARVFEQLVYGKDVPSCPGCGSHDLQRLLSVVAVGSGTPEAAPLPAGACGSCGDPRGPGACRLDRSN